MAIAATFPPAHPLTTCFALFSPSRCIFFHSSTPSISSLSLPSSATSRPIGQWRSKLSEDPRRRPPSLWRISATNSGDASPEAQQIVLASDGGGGSIVVSALLFIAFIGLSILSIGVIYLAVQDFLQKREREKFEKEEVEKKKKEGKKKKIRARAGPRGFGQKIEGEDI